MDRRHLKLNRANKGRHGKVDQGLHQSPVVMVSTMSDGEETSCQEIVDVDDNGMFQADVAVISNRGSWSAMVSACETGSGNNNANSCRSMVMLSPGEHSGDGCHPVAARADQSRQDYPGKSYYVVKADFRRCDAEEHRSNNAKPRVVAVRRSRRQAVSDRTVFLRKFNGKVTDLWMQTPRTVEKVTGGVQLLIYTGAGAYAFIGGVA